MKVFLQESDWEKHARKEIGDNPRAHVKTLHQAGCHRRDRRWQEKDRPKCTKHPFKYTSGLLGLERSGEWKALKEEVEEHLRNLHSNPETKGTWFGRKAVLTFPLTSGSPNGRRSMTSSGRSRKDRQQKVIFLSSQCRSLDRTLYLEMAFSRSQWGSSNQVMFKTASSLR